MPLSLRLASREFRRRPIRAALTFASVIIGVASLTAVATASRATRISYSRLFEALAGRAALEVVAQDGSRFELPAELSEQIRTVPGVAVAAPTLQQLTMMYANDERVRVLLIGMDPQSDAQVRSYRILEGAMPSRANEVLLEAGFARQFNFVTGGEIRILTRRGVRRLKIAGLLANEGAAIVNQGAAVFLSLGDVQRLFSLKQQVDSVKLVLADDSQAEDVAQLLAQFLPTGLKAREPLARSGLAETTLALTDQSLNLGTGLCLLAATFIVLNTFLMNVSERRKQLAILRAIGATRGQVLRFVLTEAAVLGVLGAILGLPGGYFGGIGLSQAFSGIVGSAPGDVPFNPWLIAYSIGGGPFLALLAAGYPAYKASITSPLEGMRGSSDAVGVRAWRREASLGATLCVIGGAVALAAAQGWGSAWLIVGAAAGLLFGLVLTLPLGLKLLLERLWAGPARQLPLTLRLALAQLQRHIGRTTLTSGVLFFALATGLGAGNSILNVIHDIDRWYRGTMVMDFIVRVMRPELDSSPVCDMRDELTDEVRALPGVDQVDRLSFLKAQIGEETSVLIAREFATYDFLPLDLRDGQEADVRQRLLEGGAVVGSVLAQQAGVRRGDVLAVDVGGKQLELAIAGITNEYMLGGAVLYVDRAAIAQQLPLEGVDAFFIRSRRGEVGATAAALQPLVDREGLMLQSYDELRQYVDNLVSNVTGGLWLMLVLGFLIGTFGTVNTLGMNVLENMREWGLLRIVGMQRRQVRRTIVSQAFLLGILGLVPGLAMGLLLALLNNSILALMFGREVTLALEPAFLALAVALALSLVLLASLLPARFAALQNPLEAIRWE